MEGRAVNLAGKDLNLLVALRALLEEGNVTRAGERLGLGQSGMSGALSRLRQHYQDELLIKSGRDFELTPLAKSLLLEVQDALPLVERALGVGGFDPSAALRRFTILGSDFACLEVQDRLGDLSDAPGISIDYLPLPQDPTESRQDLLQHDLVADEPDLGIEGVSSVLLTDCCVCVLDPSNPAIAQGTLTWAAFCGLPHASVNLGRHRPAPGSQRLRELGFQQQPAVEAPGYLALASLIGGTDLVAVMPSKLARRVAATTGTVIVPAPFGRVELVQSLWWHPSKLMDPGHRWIRRRILATTEA